jgi:hypothetical protein
MSIFQQHESRSHLRTRHWFLHGSRSAAPRGLESVSLIRLALLRPPALFRPRSTLRLDAFPPLSRFV